MPIERSGHSMSGAQVLRVVHEEARAALYRATLQTAGEIARLAPRRTGTLVRSITATRPTTVRGQYISMVGTNLPYGRYQNDGTGIYGPKHARIFPTHAKALRFPAGSAGFTLAGRKRSGKAGQAAQFAFAKSVKGVPALHYFEHGIAQAMPQVLREFEQGALRASRRLKGMR